MLVLKLILLVLALVLFLIASFGPDRIHPRINLIALGLACWVAVPLITLAQSAGN